MSTREVYGGEGQLKVPLTGFDFFGAVFITQSNMLTTFVNGMERQAVHYLSKSRCLPPCQHKERYVIV